MWTSYVKFHPRLIFVIATVFCLQHQSVSQEVILPTDARGEAIHYWIRNHPQLQLLVGQEGRGQLFN
jgi:hypothetical protein